MALKAKIAVENAGLSKAGQLHRFCRTTPGVLPISEADDLRMFILIDPDGNLLRCLDDLYHTTRYKG